MERRKFVIGAGALATGSAAAVGTGAFSQMVSGERSVTAEVVNDSDAFVSLIPFDPEEDDNGENGSYAGEDDGELYLEFANQGGSSSPPVGDGVNPGSQYEFDNVFRILNGGPNTGSGTGEIVVWIEHDIDELTFKTADAQTPTDDMTDHDRVPIESRADAEAAYTSISPGAVNEIAIGVDVDATELDSADDIDGEFTVHAVNASHRE